MGSASLFERLFAAGIRLVIKDVDRAVSHLQCVNVSRQCDVVIKGNVESELCFERNLITLICNSRHSRRRIPVRPKDRLLFRVRNDRL